MSSADARAKTHFVLVDTVGVCESDTALRRNASSIAKRVLQSPRKRDNTDSRPLEKKPTVAFDKLLLGIAHGKRDEDTVTALAGRLTRLERALDKTGRQESRKPALRSSGACIHFKT